MMMYWDGRLGSDDDDNDYDDYNDDVDCRDDVLWW